MKVIELVIKLRQLNQQPQLPVLFQGRYHLREQVHASCEYYLLVLLNERLGGHFQVLFQNVHVHRYLTQRRAIDELVPTNFDALPNIARFQSPLLLCRV